MLPNCIAEESGTTMTSKRYETVAEEIARRIDAGLYRPGDRIPGVRKLSHQFAVSVSTVLQAHQRLEDQGRIEARPRSGFYVRTPLLNPPEQPAMSRPPARPTLVSGQALALRLVQAANEADMVQLGAAVPDTGFLPARALSRHLAAATRRYGNRVAGYEFPPGAPELRRQIARRMADARCNVNPDEVVITGGCQEAVSIALRAVAGPGDVVAIESPTFYGLLQVIESLGMKALEIPTCSRDGISLDALQLAIEQWPVKACVLVPNFSNPLGYCMPDPRKRQLVKLLADAGIPLIEDDVYGDLGFNHVRPRAAKSWDQADGVIYCSSFSKTLSAGLRLGWVLPGRYKDQVTYQKYVLNLAAPTLEQLAVADFLARGGYDRYLRQVRGQYQRHVAQVSRAVARFFPAGTKLTRPTGGFVLWVELPRGADSMELHRRAMDQRISVAPGPMFSASQKYRNFIRLNCAQRWNEQLEQAILSLGRLAESTKR